MSFIQKYFLVLAVSISTVSTSWARVETVIGNVAIDKNVNIAINIPETSNSEIMISRDQYLISYNKNRRAPNWVAWKLELSQLGKVKRTDGFRVDSDLETYLNKHGNLHAVQSTDYKNSCFDRGHQIPSGDRTDTKYNNSMTFFMSNMLPQTPYLNRVIWEHLEEYTRELVQKQGKKVYVIAGPIYDQNFGSIGPNHDIPVPSKNFKIIYVLNSNQTPADISPSTQVISVIMPNVVKSGDAPVANTPNCGGDEVETSADVNDWQQYQTTVADIESKASLTFQH